MFDASATEVLAAFDSATFGRVAVSGAGGGPWTITFVDWAGDLADLACGATQTVTQVVVGTGRSLGGDFALAFRGEVTSPLSYDATATQVAAALNALASIDDVVVTSTTGDVNGGGSWLVTFPGSAGNVPTLELRDVYLQGESPTVTITKNQSGNEITGRVAFTWNAQESAEIQVGANAREVESTLSLINGVGRGIRVAVARLSPGFGTVFSITFPKELGNIGQLQLVDKGLTGKGIKLQAETFQEGVKPISGTFSLLYGDFRTPPLQWNVPSEELAVAIQLLQSIPVDDGVQVTRSGPGTSGGMTWRVTFPLGMPKPGQLIKVEYSSTMSGSNVAMQVALIKQETLKLSGSFQIGFRGQKTADIDVQSPNLATVQSELQKLPGLTSVNVARAQKGNSVQWDVTFVSLDAAIATPALMTADPQKLVGTGAIANVQSRRSGGRSEAQSLSIYRSLLAPTASFNVVWNGKRSTSLASSSMLAGELKVVLDTIPGLGAAIVERYPSAVGVGFTWLILLTEGTRATPLPLSIELVGSSNPSDLVIKVVVYASTLTPLSGSFSLLSTKETCMELTLGDYCTPEKTSAMPFNVDAATMAREISLLQGLEGTTVSLGRVVSNWEYEWIVTFPRAFLDMNLLQVNSAAIGGSSVDAVVRRLQKGYGLDGAKVAVEVSSNGQDYSTSGVVYHYTPAPDVFSFEPNHGPLQGGTEILVTGINFQNSSSLRCRFGTRVTAAATFLNSTQFTCVSPSGLEEGDVYMEIANHGLFGDMDDAASTFTKSKRVFTYDRDLEIDSVFPSLGATTGNVSVRITGGPFRKTHTVRCKFAEIVVVASWKSYDEILCIAPPHSAGVFTLQVTRNAQDYTDTDVPFIYYAEQGMRSISPTFGPAYTAGTRIDVDGAAFVNSSLLSCRFGYLLTPGVFVSSTKMRCTTPPLPKYSGGLVPAPLPEYRNKYADPNVGSAYLFPDAHYYPQYRTRLVSLEVSNNQQDFSLSGINFLYYEDESVEAIAPARAFDSAEPLAIFAYGRNFINTTALSCRLGLQTFPATFVTPKLLLCEVAHPMMYDDARRGSNKFHELAQPRHALFEVSNNGKVFTSSHVVFEFLGACPTGYWCPKQLQGSNGKIPCPRGTYCPGVANSDFTSCPRGTATSDGFRNDTRLRPYPCKPGTYCLKGVVADEVRIGDYSYPQNCTAGFYCELASYSPKGSGLCPPGFTCPSGTAAPVPTSKGTFAQLEGTVSAAECAPGYYAPTIESTECVPCPPGTTCEDDGTAVATICPPGSYRGSLSADGLACLACPQGTWSKNWELRGLEECLECAPGTVCPIDGISNPCTVDDLPSVYTPVAANLTFAQCLERGSNYFFGVVLEPWIDELGRGAHFLPDRDNGRCYENTQPRGSDLYQRFADFHGPLYEISTGTGVPHQGYGDSGQYPAPNMFARGSLAIDLPVSRAYDVARNCTPGFFYKKQWYPGTCEADIFCSSSVWSKVSSTDALVSQAQPCPEGYVCDSSTTADTAFSHLCPAGYVCGAGTTPDLTLDAPQGQLHELCPAGKYCVAGTAESQKERYMCPAGYFCPTGTANPLVGEIANDALRRRLSSEASNPFLDVNYTKYVGEGDIRVVSAHDMHCFDGIDDDLLGIFRLRQDINNAGKRIVVNRAEERNRLCARDHKWRTVELALRRNDCDCIAQTKVVRSVFQLWKCTVDVSTGTPTVYDSTRFGWAEVHNSAIQCTFPGARASKPLDLAPLVDVNGSGISFQTGWTETTVVHSYAELRTLVNAKYAAQIAPVDPFVYDLHHAVELIETFGEETSNIAGFVSGSSEESEEDLLRLDACACSEMFKCPNGTTSAAGADDIYNCIKTGDEVLQRVSPVPLTSARLRNGTEFQDLTGIAGQGLGSIVLEPFEVAVLTINTTQLERNITYGAHFQISVYQDCKPCPPQYKCELDDEPPACSYPDDDNTTATRLYEKCLQTYNGDTIICNNMPFFCERRTLPLAEISRSAADSGSNETMNIAGCCSCERQEMPYYFENSVVKDRGFPDNKHGYLQFSIAALEETEITIAVELVHGLYVRDFAQGFTQERFDLTVFTPGRADYSPSTPSTNTFLTVLRQADMNDIMLPLNLPEEYVRVAGTLTYKQQVVSSVLINRMSDIFVGDPELPSKRGYMRNSEQNSIGELVSVTIANVSSNGSTDGDVVVVTPTDYFGLYSVPDPWEATQRSDSWWTQELGGSEFLALPYLPYFSSCRGFDSNIFLSKMLETHPDCILVNYDQTVEVDQYPWRKKLTPNADRCLIEYTAEVAVASSLISSISSAASTLTSSSASTTTATTFETFQRGVSLSCLYEENLEGGAEKLRWYEAPTGTVLFYITRDPTASDAFVAEGDAVTGTGWGRSDTLQSYLGTDALIPVKVGDAGVPLAVPQEVYLNLSYYQVTPGQKRLVEASVNFGKLCAVTRSAELLAILAKKGISPCTFSKATNQLASKAYTLQVSWEPLNWFELMNLFQFTVDVYLGFFTLVAVASMILGFVIWVINRLFTKMKRPPKFRMKLLLKNVASAPPIGIFMASVPIFAACVLIYTWWHVLASTTPLTTPSAASFEATAGDWLDQISLDVTRVENYKRGRVGLSLIVIGIYLLMLGSKLLVPETMDSKSEDNAYKEMAVTTPEDPFSVEAEKEEEEENEFWDPRAWKRANFLLTTLCFMASMLVFWEFSYSPSFTANIYGYLVLFKIMRTAMELVLEHFLHEKLLVLPFAVVLSASESMMAMGSADFIGFTLFYFVNLTLVMMEHLYTAPLLRRTRALWPKWRLSLQRRMKKRRRRTREQKALEEAEWARVCEKIDNQAAGVEAVLEGVAGYSVVFTELFIAPILFGFQSFFSEDTRMPALYGVRQTDLLYYALFSVFIIPSNFVLGALQLNTMELAHGWKLYEYSAYQRHRFATRDTRWPLAHSSADESIHPSCQSLDLLCFSSQLYFLLLVYAAGILLSMLGVTVCLRASYSFFGDPITLLIIGVVYYLMRALELSCIRLGDKFKMWKPRKLADGTLDEDLAAKLALGAGRQRELERERLELQALNSERFRHRFLERNRPWVLQHLAELFTPRTLQSIEGPAGDGRPNSEYVRDLYHELVNMGEGRRLGGDRSDISSDGEDDLEKMRRAWSNVPVEGASRDLALYWLARARKRRTFSKLVAGIIAASRQSECGVCGKREDGGYTLHVDLAAEDGAKEHDPRALDRLIDGFESELGAQEMDSDLWKAYFRKHAAFLTLCNVCLTARQQALANRGTNKLVADMRKLRSDEFSSDEGSDEDGGDVPFAPIVVARGSIEGRVLTKWLLAARKRMGGAFPRPEAQEEMERYARKLKRSRRRAGKKDHVDSDEEGRDPSRHWRLELNEVARALAIRWVWEARDLRDAAARKTAAELREKLQALNDQIVEADDWFFGRELREAGLALRDDGAQLAEEQARIDEDLAQKVRATERDVEAFAEEKQSTNTAEERAFRELIAKEREDGKTRVAARELELLEAYKQKETEFASAQRQAREAGELAPALVAEHRTYLAKMAEDRRAELEAVEEAASAKTQQKEDSFARKLALAEAAVSSRRALSQHRILALRKEARGAVRARESAWQSKARSWIDRASRKVQVKQQEDAEAQLNDKRRRKRVLLAT
ncbi:Cell death abnormality protein 1 [Phytophthora ramorum]|uniref:Cell death abnormality protein 1 n=1 Tax=Phytophthora ramorum TaxID=164328 RepID=UPI0030A4774D|nr:Cell death abnormality protein 1 [Phytophthora ramorum]